ncbi:hypothetical protein H2200_009778 [Cladophialophora chaetospira]|uniref:Uncharacterized protein n=1 Tax=Cladophialophora chaetospira TaxID=386627 RepID=A0AA39CF62_9EURO|nr:hypothetical protein H2200_009778 [Cladophialophora chaetospira]
MPSAIDTAAETNSANLTQRNGVHKNVSDANGWHESTNGTCNVSADGHVNGSVFSAATGSHTDFSQAEIAGEVERYPSTGIDVLMYVSNIHQSWSLEMKLNAIAELDADLEVSCRLSNAGAKAALCS